MVYLQVEAHVGFQKVKLGVGEMNVKVNIIEKLIGK